MDKPLVQGNFVLERFPGKGGWTYVALPEVGPDSGNPFGWKEVRGSIDDFELVNYKLMPMGNGRLFLPVRAEIRKKIKKEEGDRVHVVLYQDNSEPEIPKEVMDCFELADPQLLKRFLQKPASERKTWLRRIAEVRLEDTRARRIAELLDQLAKEVESEK